MSPVLHGQNTLNQTVSSTNDKLVTNVAKLKSLKNAYPYVLRTVLVSAIFLTLGTTYNADQVESTFNANLNSAQSAPVLDDVTEREVSILVAQLADIVETEEVRTQLPVVEAYEPETTLVAKNQIVQTDAVTRNDIVTHTVTEGETLESIAKKFDITTDTIKWANSLTSDTVSAGDELKILPINGVLHKVSDGDTVKALADRYEAEEAAIITFNDAEIDGLVKGQTIIIPDGTKPAPAPTVNRLYSNYVARVTASYGGSYTYMMHYSAYSNPVSTSSYYRGWCTDWASYRAGVLGNPIGRQWGNARSWDTAAAAEGYYVGPVPKVGAVFQSDAGSEGHVGVVEEVSADNTMIKYSDMNGLAGWGNAAKTNDWVSAAGYDYIYR